MTDEEYKTRLSCGLILRADPESFDEIKELAEELENVKIVYQTVSPEKLEIVEKEGDADD